MLQQERTSHVSALSQAMAYCHRCHIVAPVERNQATQERVNRFSCPRCQSSISLRKTNSMNRAWFFVLLGFAVFIPSHVFPVMLITELASQPYEKTILSGVFTMFNDGLWVLSAVVFIASVLIPLVKLVGLAFLLLAVRYKWLKHRYRLTQLYRFIVFVGRWAMIDIFFAAIFISLNQLGVLGNIQAGYGATFFASMCIITMVAAEAFDPRFLWDHHEEGK